MRQVPVITNEAQHKAALARLVSLIEKDRPEDGPVMDALALLIEDYERRMFPIPAATAREAIEFRLDQRKMTRSELARRVSVPRGRISEVLSGKRDISRSMLVAFHDTLDIPYEVLLDPETVAVGSEDS